MDTLKAITRRIEDGFVLSEQGRWIYMAEQRIYERRVIDRIVNGNVLVDGKWVAIEEARRRGQAPAPKVSAPKPAAIAPPAPITPLVPPQADMASFEAMGDMLETVCIDMTAPAMIKAMDAAGLKTPAAETAADPQPARVDSVTLLFNPTKTAAAAQSRHAIEYIGERNVSGKRGGILGKLIIAAAAITATVLIFVKFLV